MGFVSSIKDFIGGESLYDEDFEEFEDDMEYEDDREPIRRSFSKFGTRRNDSYQEQSYVSESDITIIKVRKYDDATSIASVLKERRPVIFDVIEMDKSEEAEKVVNFMVGAVFAVDGNIKRISGGIFIATPKNMKINSDEIRKKTTASFGLEI